MMRNETTSTTKATQWDISVDAATFKALTNSRLRREIRAMVRNAQRDGREYVITSTQRDLFKVQSELLKVRDASRTERRWDAVNELVNAVGKVARREHQRRIDAVHANALRWGRERNAR